MKEISSGNNTILRKVPGAIDGPRGAFKSGEVPDSMFRDQLSALQNAGPTANTASKEMGRGPATLKFSNHAIDRMQSRGIRFSPEEMVKIEGAVNRAASKGAKETLLLTDNSALIVSVRDNTVVTVMDKASLKDNVFTKIDSTVVI